MVIAPARIRRGYCAAFQLPADSRKYVPDDWGGGFVSH